MKTVLALLTLACFPGGLAACVYENEPPRRLTPDPGGDSANAPSQGGGNLGGIGGEAPSTGSPGPMLVVVDTDQTMNAAPGDGVGVFIEYAAGGKWHLWWTCDTARTQQSCEFAVSATAATGNVSNVDAAELAGGFVTSSTPSRVDAKSTTTTEVHGIRFETAPGAVITVEAAVGGLKDGAFLFFVQDGKVNGGFTGRLTNPLQVQGNAP